MRGQRTHDACARVSSKLDMAGEGVCELEDAQLETSKVRSNEENSQIEQVGISKNCGALISQAPGESQWEVHERKEQWGKELSKNNSARPSI